jgi:hypothetical protein
MYRLPFESTAIPCITEKVALVAGPPSPILLPELGNPLPATVEMVAPEISRTQ